MSDSGGRWGLLAQLDGPEALLAACRRLRKEGYRRWDAHAPYPVHGFAQAMGLGPSRVPRLVLAGAIAGALAGFGLQAWVSGVAYPLVISGKPFFSWPAFVPIAFETAVLGGALGAITGFLLFSGLPQLHHPLFGSTRFEQTTDAGFFVAVEAADPLFDVESTRRLLEALGAIAIEDVRDDS